jgi:hypothetical protein
MKVKLIGIGMNRVLLVLVLFIFLLGINPFERSQAQAPYVYYGLNQPPWTLRRVNSDGSDPLDLYTAAINLVQSIAIDHSGKIYYYDPDDGTGKTYRANLDGSSSTLIKTGVMNAIGAGNGYFYYSLNTSPFSLTRVNTDGSNPVTIYTPSSGAVRKIAVDFLNNKLYFYDDEGSGTIYKSDLDGSNRTIFTTGDILSLAVGAGYVYYSFSGDPWSLMRRNVDGTNPITVYTPPSYFVHQTAVDSTNSKVYFYDGSEGNETVFIADLDGSNRTTFLSAKISSLAVHGESPTSVMVNNYTGINRKGIDYRNIIFLLLGGTLLGFASLKLRHFPS